MTEKLLTGTLSLNTTNQSETTGPIEAKLHMESPWDGVMKVCSNGPGQVDQDGQHAKIQW